MDYTFFLHPARYTELVQPTPKELWKRKHHAIRYERRYGNPPKISRGELGTVDGFRFIESSKTA